MAKHRARSKAAAARQKLLDPVAYYARMERKAQVRLARKRGASKAEYIDRTIVFERDEGICGICGGEADASDFHVDHVIPLSRGGEHTYTNVQVAHPLCNQRKGSS
jgi:5-methylcytosine-specific restriction endonuclease McrA